MIKVDCPKLKKGDWDRKRFDWNDKPFLMLKYRSFLGIPINKRYTEKKAVKMLNEKDLLPGIPLILLRNETIWGGEVLVELACEDPISNCHVSGSFFTMFFEGHFKDMGKWYKRLRKECKRLKMKINEIVAYYPLCDLCCDMHGKAQLVLIASIEKI